MKKYANFSTNRVLCSIDFLFTLNLVLIELFVSRRAILLGADILKKVKDVKRENKNGKIRLVQEISN